MTYTSTITSASLRLRESRVVAGLLLDEVDRPTSTNVEAWTKTLLHDNVLQMGSPVSIRRIARLIRARLEPMGIGLWHMVRDGDRTLATQAVFAAALKESRLLADFMRFVIHDHHVVFAKQLAPHCWSDFIAACRGRDPDMPRWSEATINKLRSAVFSMLAEVGYISDSKSLALQHVYVEPRLATYLRDNGEGLVLRCMEPAE